MNEKSSRAKDKILDIKDTGSTLIKGSGTLIKAGVGIAIGAAALGLGIGAAQGNL